MNYQSAFKMLASETFGQKNMLVVPVVLIEFLDGNVAAAMHLYQILYWAGKTKNGEFYKRYAEWQAELFQSVNRLRANVAMFVRMGLIETKVSRVQIRDANGRLTKHYGDKAIFYRVDWEAFEKLFLAFVEQTDPPRNRGTNRDSGNLESPIWDFPTGSNGDLENPIRDFPIGTENTTETTSREKQKTLSEPENSDRTSETSSLPDEEKQPTSTSSKTNGSSHRGKQPSPWDERAAIEFAEVVRTHRKVQKNSDLRQWAKVFRQMREVDKTSKKDIGETIVWYRKHIGEDFVPEAFSAAAFRKKFNEGKFASAMRRSQNGSTSSNGRRLTRETMWNEPDNVLSGGMSLKVEIGSDGREYDGQLLYKIRCRVLERFGSGLPLPEELKAVLEEDFPDAENLTPSIIGSVG